MATYQNSDIDTPTLRELAAAGAIGHLVARGTHGGFLIVAQVGMGERVLRTQRGGARIFKTLDAVVPYLRSIGLSRIEVDVEHLSAGGLFKR